MNYLSGKIYSKSTICELRFQTDGQQQPSRLNFWMKRRLSRKGY